MAEEKSIPKAYRFQGGIGLAVAIGVFQPLAQAFGYNPELLVVGAWAAIVGAIFKYAGIQIEE